MDKFKVIKEYPNYYLCEHEKFGYKECFSKVEYRPNEDGYIIKHEIDLRKAKQVPLPSQLEESYREFFKVGV